MSKPALIAILLALPMTAVVAAEADAERVIKSPGYGGEARVADIMAAEYLRIRETRPDARIRFSVTIPAVLDGDTRVESLDGLPVSHGDDGSPSGHTDITLDIPFDPSMFEQAGTFDDHGFTHHVDGHLARMRSNGSTSDCGGHPLGTLVTSQTDKACAGTFEQALACSIDDDTGRTHWRSGRATWTANTSDHCLVSTASP